MSQQLYNKTRSVFQRDKYRFFILVWIYVGLQTPKMGNNANFVCLHFAGFFSRTI